ncbi:MAG: hypothetical protein ACO1PI_15020 [Bacteroidota bacterium]
MKYTYLTILIIFSVIIKANKNGPNIDSIKVHVIGYFFKNESFKFHDRVANRTTYKKVKKGINAFAFYTYISDTIKNGDIIHLRIVRKSFLGCKYVDTRGVVIYEDDRKYLVFWRDFRMKDRYSFVIDWWNSPFLYFGGLEFWELKEISDKFKCDKIEYW